MYISNIKLKNIRCFKELEIDFNVQLETPEWTMILGDNSSGKSTLLKAIALGLCNEYKATSLLEKMPGTFIRKKEDEAMIRIKLKRKSETITISADIRFDNNKNEFLSDAGRASNNRELGQFSPFDEIFVCAYGATRSTESSFILEDSKQKYIITKAISSLFNENTFLNLELYLQRLKNDFENKKKKTSENKISEAKYNNIIKKLNKILELPEEKTIVLTKEGFLINDIHLSSIGDGYKSTLTWVFDLLGQAILANKYSMNADLQGIVIIDELERHLHPSWQRKIVKTLRQVFPKIQFITTTHSPLVAASMADIDNGRLIVLKEGSYEDVGINEIKGLKPDEILVSELFDLPATTAINFTEDMKILEKYINTGISKLTAKQKKEYKDILKKWNKHIDNAENIINITETKSNLEKIMKDLD